MRRRTIDLITAGMKRLDEPSRQGALQEVVAQAQVAIGDLPPGTPIMGWDGARTLAEMGFTIGSHSNRHSILANEPAEVQRRDLHDARLELSKGVGCDVDLLAYPNGKSDDFDLSTIEASRQAGYRAAVTTIQGWNDVTTDRFQLRRFVMYPEWQRKGFGIVPRHTVRRLLGTVR
jgi:peptidoglycan/xylan/chitin deacetylase (PgdA/CDA1 family)